jgi:type IV pilus assembly protein PilM
MISSLQEIFSPQFRKPLIGVDIGSHSLKFAEILLKESEKPEVLSFGHTKIPKDVFIGSMPAKKDVIGKAILELFEEKQVETKRVSFALPSSAVFTKRISLSKAAAENLESNIEFEASNYIPHRIDAINLDYQILDDSGSMAEVLLVAVKHEILDAYREIFESVGLEGVIADVESFAAQNILEFTNPEMHKKTVALLDIGYRHITVTLLKDGIFLLSGDVGSGVRQYYDALVSALEISMDQAGILLEGGTVPGADASLVQETIDKTSEKIVAELQKQMGFFWNGAGIDSMIEQVVVIGGGSHVPQLSDEIASHLGAPCASLDLGSAFDFSAVCRDSWNEGLSSSMALAMGLGIRRSGDRVQR